MAIDCMIEDARWADVGFEGLAAASVTAALAHLDVDVDAFDVSIMACDDARIAVLNAEFREKPQPTNVLSWPSEERAAEVDGARPNPPQLDPHGDTELGDIAISFETCAREAEVGNKPLADHITHLIVHGTLHLLGFDHETDADAALMEGLETEILGKLGLPDPYMV